MRGIPTECKPAVWRVPLGRWPHLRRAPRSCILAATRPSPAGVGPAVPQQCPESGSGFQMGGPFWAEALHDPEWVQGLLEQVRADKDM